MKGFKGLPDAARKVLEVISIWSIIDARLTIILAQMLKADYEVAAAMYRAISSGPGRRAVLDAAAAYALAGPSFCLLQAVLKVTKPSRDTRNDFAHHVWAYDDNLPKALLLVPPDDLAFLHIDTRKHHESGKLARWNVVMKDGKQTVIPKDTPSLDGERIMVWRQNDLDRAAKLALEADTFFGHLWIALSDSPEHEERRKQLFDVPAIEQAFDILCQQNDQSALLRQRHKKPPST